jgi:Trk K+ transport system NAD-binding subunit
MEKFINWRTVWAAVAFGLAMAAFVGGVTLSEQPLLDGVLAYAYYSLSLFVLGGVDLGVPTGGPDWARVLMWVAYFAAPVLTVSAVVEGLYRTLTPQRWQLRNISGHTIIVGTDHLARGCLQRLAQRHVAGEVVLVHPPQSKEASERLANKFGAIVVQDRILGEGMLERLHADRAQRIMLLTEHDCTNLEVASRVLEMGAAQSPQIVVHLSDLGMLRRLKHSGLLDDVGLFNGHELAARRLVETRLLAHFETTGPQDQVVLAGFGTFGQTVLDQLQQQTAELISRVVLVDRNVSSQAALFDEQVGFSDSFERTEISGDMIDPHTWRSTLAALEESDARPVFIFGTGDEHLNLRSAMMLAESLPDAMLVVRSYYHPALARRMESRRDFVIHNVADLLQSAIEEMVMPQSIPQGQSSAQGSK